MEEGIFYIGTFSIILTFHESNSFNFSIQHLVIYFIIIPTIRSSTRLNLFRTIF
jgi:hypothetical protein